MSGSQRRSDYATVHFDLALEGRFLSLFYLKSGKPQEGTLSFLFWSPGPSEHQEVFIGLHACAVRPAEETHNSTNTARLHMDGRV